MSEDQIKQLGEILTDEQIAEVVKLLNSFDDDFDRCNAIKRYLNKFRDALETKGVIPDYLAYLIVYKMQEMRKHPPERNN
jgi:hypothetical protein